MNTSIKKIVSYILIALVLIFTLIAILGIWDVISLEEILKKILASLFIIFVASVVVLFIFTVLIKNNDKAD